MKNANIARKCAQGEPPHEMAYVWPEAETTKTINLAIVFRKGSHFAREMGLKTPCVSISWTGTFHRRPQKSFRVPIKYSNVSFYTRVFGIS